MTDRPLIGLVLALVVEARHWTRVRWDFDDDTCSRVWRFTVLATALAAVSIWMDGKRLTALPTLLSWLPALLLPLQFVQSYGLRESLPLNMFSFLAKQRRLRNERLGLVEETVYFHFGNVMFATAVVGAAVGDRADSWLFLPGLVVLGGWILLAAGGSRPRTLVPVLLVAGLCALVGQAGLERAARWFAGGGAGPDGRHEGFDPDYSSTLIGSRGSIRQSPDIEWRLRALDGAAAPSLLRTGTFRMFFRTYWSNRRGGDTEFSELETRVIGEEPYYLLTDASRAEELPHLPAFNLRGAVTREKPLPLPGDAAGLRDFEAGKLERGPLGCVRVVPEHPVIDGTVFWRGGTNPEQPPVPGEDLLVPRSEQAAVDAAVEAAALGSTSDMRMKLALLRGWFARNFRYTRHLTIQQPVGDRRNGRSGATTALGVFLGEVRAGHCEYFATAATLMLREAGIPARYATGYAVIERDAQPGRFVIRGTHGHAWCRVWDQAAGLWIDFDPTPPDWFASLPAGMSRSQRLADFFTAFREDFYLWRNRPEVQLTTSVVMACVGLGLGGYVVRRLWRSRRHVTRGAAGGPVSAGRTVQTPLHALEALARRHLGLRPPGVPLGEWFLRLREIVQEPAVLEEAIRLHQRLRFDPAEPPQGCRDRLAELARALEKMLKKS